MCLSAFRKSFLYCYDWLILLANRSATSTSSCVCVLRSHVPHNFCAPGLSTGGLCDDCALIHALPAQEATAPQLLLVLMAGALKYLFLEIQLHEKLTPQTNSSIQNSKANQLLHTCSKVLKEEVLVAMLPVPCSEPL